MRILPNRDVYEREVNEFDRISTEQDYDFDLKHIDFNRNLGILVYYHNAEFPQRGAAEPDALKGINIVKKIAVNSTKLIMNKEFYPTILWFLLKTKKGKAKFITKTFLAFNNVAQRCLEENLIKRCYMTPTGKNLDLLVYKTLLNMQVQEKVANDFARYFSSMFELDNAYRFRLQDAISEINNDAMFKDPASEFIRVFKIYQSRDIDAISEKMKILEPAIKIFFKFKWFTKPFMKALRDVGIDNMRFDANDIYWTNQRDDYKFRGIDYSERVKLVNKFPKRIYRK